MIWGAWPLFFVGDTILAYQVIARKWRPKSFSELVGQDHISQTLSNALQNDRLPHALLFTGPRGTGKTSSARILAKALRCPNSTNFVPCNQCSECDLISQGVSLDVIEIDGASNNGVDSVRELRESVGYRPAFGKYKIYIIDEVHMLTGSAFNALLKTLEEPPEHVIFIMATTEVHKIPNTILSRCQRFDFRRISTRKICQHLESICKKDNVSFSPEALWSIARQGDGSMRDSQSLLDQVVTFSSHNITTESVIAALGLTDRNLLIQTVQCVVQRNLTGTLDIVEKIFSSGLDVKVFCQDLLEEMRNLLLIKIGGASCEHIIDLPDSEVDLLKKLATPLSEGDIHLLFDMILKGANDIPKSQEPRIVLEMLLLRMAQAPNIINLTNFLQQGSSSSSEQLSSSKANREQPVNLVSENQNGISKFHVRSAENNSLSSEPVGSKTENINSLPNIKIPSQQEINKEISKAVENLSDNRQGLTLQTSKPVVDNVPNSANSLNEILEKTKNETLEEKWSQLVNKIRGVNSLIAAKLEHSYPISIQNQHIKIAIPTKMKFLHQQILEPDFQKKLGNYIKTFWGQPHTLEIQLENLTEKSSESLSPKALNEQKEETQKKKILSEVENHPLVKQTQSLFKTQIQEIKELK